MNNLMQKSRQIEKFIQENDKALKQLFSGKIKGNFLINTKNKVVNAMGESIYKCYDLQMSLDKFIAQNMDTAVEYDICRHIVGIHRSNLIFLTDAERVALERNGDYQKELVDDVVDQVRLRRYGSYAFRKQPIMRGENFIYYPLPYYFFVLCIRMNEILQNKKLENKTINSFLVSISNKGLASLALLEDNFLDNAYPICRGIIELYLKMLVLLNNPPAINEYERFCDYEIHKSFCEQKYSRDFKTAYQNKQSTAYCKMADYLHWGWVDSIEHYHNIVKQNPYSISGVIGYIKILYKDDIIFVSNLDFLYKICNGYTHGNTIRARYPLLYYFEINFMLYETLLHSYEILCETCNIDKKIEDIDIVEKIEKYYAKFEKQYQQRNTEKFEEYYKINKV